MDFHSFVRKDLQSLCKLNKIPANRTNLAMADALSSLETVKGIEKFCKWSELSVAESSVESPEKNVVTSPRTTRTKRRKQVREGGGVVQTVTPFTHRRNRVLVGSVKTVQRVYNTRLSAKLFKKEVMESKKKECVEAVKISSYCDVVSDNDLGEVLEGKNVTGSDNAGVESPVSEVEQESECLKWKDADKYLHLRDTAATNMESKMLENNELQVDTMSESVLEIPSDDNMVVSDKPLHRKKGCLAWLDDVGVDLCLSKTDISTEVFAHEGSVGVGVESPVSNIEQESESLKWKVADKDMGLRDIAAANVQPKVLENNGLQVDTMLESVLEMPRDGSLVVIDKPLHNKKVDVGIDICLSKIYISTEVLPHEVSVGVGVESPVSKIGQESESLKWKDADKDLGSSDTAVTNMKSNVLENNGLQVDTMLESVLEMPSNDNMMVIDKPLHNKKDDVGVNLCLPKTDISTEVLAPEGSVYVYVESPVCEIKQESGSLKWKDADEDLDSRDTAATNMNSQVLENNGSQVDTMLESVLEMPGDENIVVINKPLHIEKDDIGVGLCLSNADLSTEVLAHEVSVYVDEESPISKTEQERESLQWSGADKDLDLSNTATTNMKSKVLEKNGLQVDTMSESNLEMPRVDNMVLMGKPLHNKDDVGVDLSLSKTDVSTEVLAHGVKVFQMNTDNAVVDTPTNEKEAAIPSVSLQEKESVSFSEKEFHSESPKRVSGESLDAQVTALTDLKVLVLNGKGSEIVGVESPVSEIEQESECLKWKDADKDLDSRDIASTNMESKVLENNDDVGVDLCLPETDISSEVLAPEESVNLVVESPVCDIKQESGSLKWKDADEDMDSRDTAATNMNSKVLENNDDVVADVSLSEIYMATEVIAHEDSQKAVVEMPIHETKVVEQVFSMQKNESSLEAFENNSCNTEAGLDFLEYAMQQDRKRESIASQILCDSYTEKESSDLSDTSDSFDSSVGFSSKVARYHQLASANSLTKESALRAESDVSYCCSGIKNMRFDENEQASEVKSPSFFKQRGQMCPSSAPPVLPPRKAKIACSERPLIIADHPFTQKYMSSGVRALEPTLKLKSNVFKDKENIEENENLGFHNDKNESPVSKKSDVGLYVRSPR